MIPSIETLLFGTAILLIISVIASKISSKISVPALVLFLVIGMLAGSEGVGGIYFDDPQVAQSLGVVALIFILFSGGLDTPVGEIRRIIGRGVVLSTVGVLVTAVMVAVFMMLLLDFTPLEAFLMGAIVSATDAAAVFSILRTQKIGLRGDTTPLLELESGSNDPMAIFLTVGAIELILKPDMPFINLLGFFAQQMVIGAAMGFGIGYLAVRSINKLRLEADGLYSVFTIGLVLFSYALTAMLGGSGFLAVYIVGLVMASKPFIHKTSLSRFHDALSWLMQIILFLSLGLLVFPSRLIPIAGTGILIAIILIFIARPVSVFLSLIFSAFDVRDKLMISWVGLRGATPIVLATFPLLAGIPESAVFFNIVFFVVVISVLLQGSTLIPVAKMLGISRPLEGKPQYPFEVVTNNDLRNEMAEIKVGEHSTVVNQQIVNLSLPEGSLIVLIARGHGIVVPNGNTIIEAGDTLLVMAEKEALDRIRATI